MSRLPPQGGHPSTGRAASRKRYIRDRPLHPLELLLGQKLLTRDGQTISPRTFAQEGCVIGIYFAAHWCPPCRAFSPQLAQLQDTLRGKNKRLEVVFVSFDYNQQQFTEYFAKMPWYAVDFTDSDKREEIALRFGIRGIPVLILMEAMSLEVFTLNGREVVATDPTGQMFPWKYTGLPPTARTTSGMSIRASQASLNQQAPPRTEERLPSVGSSRRSSLKGTTISTRKTSGSRKKSSPVDPANGKETERARETGAQQQHQRQQQQQQQQQQHQRTEGE